MLVKRHAYPAQFDGVPSDYPRVPKVKTKTQRMRRTNVAKRATFGRTSTLSQVDHLEKVLGRRPKPSCLRAAQRATPLTQ